MCVAEDEQARALAPIGPVEGYSSSEEESAMVRGAVRDARAKAAPPAAPTPQVTLGCHLACLSLTSLTCGCLAITS